MSSRRMRRRARLLAAVGTGLVLGVLAFAAVLPAFANHVAPDTVTLHTTTEATP